MNAKENNEIYRKLLALLRADACNFNEKSHRGKIDRSFRALEKIFQPSARPGRKISNKYNEFNEKNLGVHSGCV